MPLSNTIPLPLNTPIGMHGSIKLGPAENSLVEYDIASGSFTLTRGLIKKPSTRRRVNRSEPSLIDGTMQFTINEEADDPSEIFASEVLFFEYEVTGRVILKGQFLWGQDNDSWDAVGDAPSSYSGNIQDIEMEANPAVAPSPSPTPTPTP